MIGALMVDSRGEPKKKKKKKERRTRRKRKEKKEKEEKGNNLVNFQLTTCQGLIRPRGLH